MASDADEQRRANPGRTAVVIVLVVATLAGCSFGGRSERKKAQAARNDQAAAALRAALAAMPEVTRAEVDYANSFGHAGSVGVNLDLAPGSDLEKAADHAVDQVWQSRFEPLRSMSVAVGSNTGSGPIVRRSYTVVDDGAELEARYGPRPRASH